MPTKKVSKKKAVSKKTAAKKTSTKKTADKPEIVGGDLAKAPAMSGSHVHVMMGKTINIGNYESCRVDIGIQRAVSEGESFDEVMEATQADVVAKVSDAIQLVESTFG